jgi:hypothetical protein
LLLLLPPSLLLLLMLLHGIAILEAQGSSFSSLLSCVCEPPTHPTLTFNCCCCCCFAAAAAAAAAALLLLLLPLFLHSGTLLIPQEPFELLVRRSIGRLESPALSCKVRCNFTFLQAPFCCYF